MTTISKNERDFILQAAASELRLDGRRLLDHRRLRITLGESTGHAEVQLGQTRVMACVSAEVVRPFPDRPTEGILTFSTEFSPMASPSFEVGRPSDSSVALQRLLERAVKKTRAIDTEALCIVAGHHVWSLRVDVHMLDDNGNLTDAASIAVISALIHFRKPEVSVAADTVVIHSKEEQVPTPLTIHHIPVCVSFAFLVADDGSVMVIADPTHREEMVEAGSVTFVLSTIHEPLLCGISKSGPPISPDLMYRLADFATTRAAELTAVVKGVTDKFLELENLRNFGKIAPTPVGPLEYSSLDVEAKQNELMENVDEEEEEEEDGDVIERKESHGGSKHQDQHHQHQIDDAMDVSEENGKKVSSNEQDEKDSKKKGKKPKEKAAAVKEEDDDDDDDDDDLSKHIKKSDGKKKKKGKGM